MFDSPAFAISSIIASYWLIVLAKTALAQKHTNQKKTLTPQLSTERRIWPLWTVVVVTWYVLPTIAVFFENNWYGLPSWAQSETIQPLRWVASSLAGILLLTTIYCWISMGKSWSVAVIPGELRTLITSGPFAVVRHPIYSLSIQLMICSVVVVPNLCLAICASLHIALLLRKVQIEELALAAQFGPEWHRYALRTNRLFPKLVSMRSHTRPSPPPPPKLLERTNTSVNNNSTGAASLNTGSRGTSMNSTTSEREIHKRFP